MAAAFRHQSGKAGRTRGGAASLKDRTLPGGNRSRRAAISRPPEPMTRQPERETGRPLRRAPDACWRAAGLGFASAVNSPRQSLQLTAPPPWHLRSSAACAQAADLKNIRAVFPATTTAGSGSGAPWRLRRFWAVPAPSSNFDGSWGKHPSPEPLPILLRSGGRGLLISALPPRRTTVSRTRTFMPAESSYVTRCPGGRARAVPGLLLACSDSLGRSMMCAGSRQATTALSEPVSWRSPRAGDGRA
jgi:hypothetical protein